MDGQNKAFSYFLGEIQRLFSITDKVISDKSNVSDSTLRHWRSGRRLPNRELLDAVIANFVG